MTFKEGKSVIAELKSEGMTEEQILATFYAAFQAGDINVDELGELASLVGYELTDEFKRMETEEQKETGLGKNPFLDEEEEEEEEEFEEEEKPEEPEEGEKDKAMKLFGLGKKDK